MKNPNLPLPKAALIQLILFVILFFLNIYSFFSEDGLENVTIIITVIVVVSMLLGLAAFWINRKQLFKDKKVNTLEIVSLVSLGLLTLISILSSFSALVVWVVVGGLG
ncbi:MAG: hypothetical protein COA32_08935 [Fluviicola sp.]|nr:MAG: hypothetical protein COA32_08935 [Fluviicola sp.]